MMNREEGRTETKGRGDRKRENGGKEDKEETGDKP